MRICVSGQSGWVGQHVLRRLKQRGHIVVDELQDSLDALIHLAWHRLPFDDVKQLENVTWQKDYLRRAMVEGDISNITIAGTCLETVPIRTPYAAAKLAVKEFITRLIPEAKWARLWYLYGEGQRGDCLLPRLEAAIKSGQKTFSIIDGERDFINVTEAARQLVTLAEYIPESGMGLNTATFDICSGKAESVRSFCERHSPPGAIQFVTDYPVPAYEPYSFHGNSERMKLGKGA